MWRERLGPDYSPYFSYYLKHTNVSTSYAVLCMDVGSSTANGMHVKSTIMVSPKRC